jgi:DnaJ-class molecular chaperone
MIEDGASPGLMIPASLVKCSECNGTGQYPILEEEDFTQMAECESCGGTGKEQP